MKHEDIESVLNQADNHVRGQINQWQNHVLKTKDILSDRATNPRRTLVIYSFVVAVMCWTKQVPTKITQFGFDLTIPFDLVPLRAVIIVNSILRGPAVATATCRVVELSTGRILRSQSYDQPGDDESSPGFEPLTVTARTLAAAVRDSIQ